MVRAAVMIGRISMTWQDNRRLQLSRADNGVVEIVNLKPKQNAFAISVPFPCTSLGSPIRP